MLYPSQLTVLVSDVPEVRQFIRLALEREGYRIVEAEPGPVAIEAPLPDAIITNKPWNFMEFGTRVIYISGDPDWRAARLCTAVLQKPFRVQELVAAVRKALPAGTIAAAVSEVRPDRGCA